MKINAKVQLQFVNTRKTVDMMSTAIGIEKATRYGPSYCSSPVNLRKITSENGKSMKHGTNKLHAKNKVNEDGTLSEKNPIWHSKIFSKEIVSH